MPVEPAPCRWQLPDLSDPAQRAAPTDDLVAVGADLEPGTLLAAYRSGLFPMADLDRPRELGSLTWWCPVERGVLPLDGLRVSRSLRRACARFEVRVDTAFGDVVEACADPGRAGSWISPGIAEAYGELHRLGWAHSVETWSGGEAVGGLYGVALGGLFAGESMFHHATDASKVALVGLVDLLSSDGHPDRLVDVQWQTPHLASLGVVTVPRLSYLRRLPALLDAPLPSRWR